jgi:hypothetical protein
MSKPSAPQQTGLDEVERAISLLEGRHPEHERARREAREAALERGGVLERELGAKSRRRRRRVLVICANAFALAAAAFVAWRLVGRARAIRTALASAEAPFAAHGFVELANNDLSAASSLAVETPAASCFIALAASGAVTVRAGPRTATADGSVGWCGCSAERAMVEGTAGGDGLAVMSVGARSLGGAFARPWLGFAPRAWAPGGEECSESALDDWIADGRWPRAPLDESWLDGVPARTHLKDAGFRVVAGVEPSRPFGVLETSPGGCFLAAAKGDDVLSLRAVGGVRRIAGARGALAWCKEASETITVWRDGSSAVVILSAPASRVGGILGVRESAEIAGIHVPAASAWLGDEDFGWDAASLLRASTVSDLKVSPLPAEPGPVDSRLAAIVSRGASGGANVAWQPPGAVLACDPPLEPSPDLREVVCASTEPVSWWRPTDSSVAAARAKLPLWLAVLEPRRESDAVARIPELLSLARRLEREGFAPSVLEGVTELPDGVRVVGRAGEDAVVAVGLGPRPPWVFPFTDGVPWDLGDSPRIVELAPGAKVKLVALPPPNAPIEKRRTVVFRHTASR